MVVPPPPADAEHPQADWLKRVRRLLLLGSKQTMILVDPPHSGQLRPLVRLLLDVDSGARVIRGAEKLLELPDNSLVLFYLERSELDWLNINRTLFQRKRLRVVFWMPILYQGQEPAILSLRERAPDLLDWISHVVECPFAPPRFAVEGVREGLKHWRGVVWTGSLSGLEAVLDHLGLSHESVDVGWPLPSLVSLLRQRRESSVLVAHDVGSVPAARRLHWARIISGAQQPTVVRSAEPLPGWYTAHDNVASFEHTELFFKGRLRHAETIRALVEGDLEAIGLISKALRERVVSPEALEALLLSSREPALEVARLVSEDTLSSLNLRAGVCQLPADNDEVAALLRVPGQSWERFARLAVLAQQVGEPSSAIWWLQSAIFHAPSKTGVALLKQAGEQRVWVREFLSERLLSADALEHPAGEAARVRWSAGVRFFQEAGIVHTTYAVAAWIWEGEGRLPEAEACLASAADISRLIWSAVRAYPELPSYFFDFGTPLLRHAESLFRLQRDSEARAVLDELDAEIANPPDGFVFSERFLKQLTALREDHRNS